MQSALRLLDFGPLADACGFATNSANDHKIGCITLQKLKPSGVEAWRLAMARTLVIPQDKKTSPTRPRAPSTVNRDMTCLRAAFNLALENGETTSDTAWKTKLRPIKDADGRRDV